MARAKANIKSKSDEFATVPAKTFYDGGKTICCPSIV